MLAHLENVNFSISPCIYINQHDMVHFVNVKSVSQSFKITQSTDVPGFSTSFNALYSANCSWLCQTDNLICEYGSKVQPLSSTSWHYLRYSVLCWIIWLLLQKHNYEWVLLIRNYSALPFFCYSSSIISTVCVQHFHHNPSEAFHAKAK